MLYQKRKLTLSNCLVQNFSLLSFYFLRKATWNRLLKITWSFNSTDLLNLELNLFLLIHPFIEFIYSSLNWISLCSNDWILSFLLIMINLSLFKWSILSNSLIMINFTLLYWSKKLFGIRKFINEICHQDGARTWEAWG